MGMQAGAFAYVSGRLVFDNGVVKIWRCPGCKCWRQWEDEKCGVCSAARDFASHPAINPSQNPEAPAGSVK